jgi:hypothetical protein
MRLAVQVRCAAGVPGTVGWGAACGGSGWATECSGCYEGAHSGIETKQALAEYKVLTITVSGRHKSARARVSLQRSRQTYSIRGLMAAMVGGH